MPIVRNKLSHKLKFQYSLSLKMTTDDDLKWLYKITSKEFKKRFGVTTIDLKERCDK